MILKLGEELDIQGLNESEKNKEGPQTKQYREQGSSNNEYTASNFDHNKLTNFPDSNIVHTDENSFEETTLVLADVYSQNGSKKAKMILKQKFIE